MGSVQLNVGEITSGQSEDCPVYSKGLIYSGLGNPSNVWRFWTGRGVAPEGVDLALSTERIKLVLHLGFQMVFRSCNVNEQL